MKRIISALVLVTLTTLGVAGCGDDDDSSTTVGGTGNAAGEPNSTAGETTTAGSDGGGGAPTSGNVTCDPAENGVCQNDTDCPFVADGTARITSGTCGKGCIGKAETCSRDCITGEIDMTPECATCYADTVNCTIKNCTGQCFTDPEADVCKQCQVDSGCRDAFDACSGLPG
jgi:hypothetical protein